MPTDTDSKDSHYKAKFKKSIHNRITALLDNEVQQHSKLLVVRFDLRYPQEDSEALCATQTNDTDTPPIKNTDISRFSAKLVQKYARKGYDPAYVWVREQGGDSACPHYHCALLLNGHKTRHYNQVFQDAESLWQSTLGTEQKGLVDRCMRSKNGTPHENGILLVRSAPDFEKRYAEVSNQLSYLAKEATKAPSGDGMRDIGMSQGPKRQTKRRRPLHRSNAITLNSEKE